MGSEASKGAASGGSGGQNNKHHSRRLSVCSNRGGSASADMASGDSRRHASSSSNNLVGGLPPPTMTSSSCKFNASNSCNENLLGVGLSQADSRSRSGSASSPGKPKKSPIALKNRQLIQSCFQNPHENLGKRILKRTAEKRKDFARFYFSLNFEQKDDVEETIKTLLKKCVANIEFIDEVQRLASEFGGHFVKYRQIGFKADYFSSIGDATITECVFLDNAVHQAHQTLNAFSQFITMLLTAVRDGFYNEMKRLRRTSNSFSTGSNGSNGNEKKVSAGSCDVSPRSTSPATESLHRNNNNNVSEVEQQMEDKEFMRRQEDEKKRMQEKMEEQKYKEAEKEKENDLMKNLPNVQKLSRAEVSSKCDAVFKEGRTVTFQSVKFDTVVATKIIVPTNDNHNAEAVEANNNMKSIGADEEALNITVNDNEPHPIAHENNEENVEQQQNLSGETEDECADATENEPKASRRMITAAGVVPLYDNASQRKSLLPPSVAAIFES